MNTLALMALAIYHFLSDDAFGLLRENLAHDAASVAAFVTPDPNIEPGASFAAARAAELSGRSEVYWPRSAVSEAGHAAIPETPETALQVLKQMAESGDPATRQRAVEALGRSGDDAGLDLAVAALTDPSSEVRRTAAEALASCDEDAVFDRVLELLCSDWPSTAETMGDVLPELGRLLDTRMAKTLEDAQQPVLQRAAAAYALGRMGQASGTELLTEAAWSDEPVLAVTSTRALASLTGGEAVRSLGKLLGHPLFDVRWAAVDGLASAGTPEAVALLGSAAADTAAENRGLAERALDAIERAPAAQAVPALIRALQGSLETRRRAARMLQDFTGMNFGVSPALWEAWYQSAHPAPRGVPPLVQGIPPPPPLEEAVVPPRISVDLPPEDEGRRAGARRSEGGFSR